MGIKFLCTQCGKKLNVKAFLAGKRAICPHCSHKIEIPPEAAEHTIMTGVSPLAALRTAGGTAPAMAVPVTGGVPVRPASPGTAISAVPAAMPLPSGHAPVAPSSSMPQPHLSGMPAPAPAQPVAQAAPIYVAPTAVATPMPAALPTPMQVTAPQPATPPDPITEAPTAVWYVRPPTGGQFGPAPGDTMRKWIVEGRVTADSLVWREGWADWKGAGGIFPSLGATLPPPAISAGPNAVAPSTSSAKTPLTARGGGSNMAMTLVIVLIILIIPLLGILIYVLTRQPAPPAPRKDTAHRVATRHVGRVSNPSYMPRESFESLSHRSAFS